MNDMISRSEMISITGASVQRIEENLLKGVLGLKAAVLHNRVKAQCYALYGLKDWQFVRDENRLLGWAVIAEINRRQRLGTL